MNQAFHVTLEKPLSYVTCTCFIQADSCSTASALVPWFQGWIPFWLCYDFVILSENQDIFTLPFVHVERPLTFCFISCRYACLWQGQAKVKSSWLHKLVAVSMRIVLTFIISYFPCASQHYKLVWPIASGSTTGFFVWLFAGIFWQINICLYTHPLGGWEVVLLVFAIHGGDGLDTLSNVYDCT
jgi:hypothetical protein